MLSYVDKRHADANYEAELKALVDGLHAMFQLVSEQFNLMEKAAHDHADTPVDAKNISKDMDKDINRLQLEIDKRVHVLLSKYSPQLSELRFVLSASKIAGQFERMGDHCKNTIKRMMRTRASLTPELWNTIATIVSNVSPSIRGLESVILHFDEEAAEHVCVSDDAVDKSYKGLVAGVADALKTDALPNERVADVLFIAKNLERLADHATAIAREFLYIHSGERRTAS